jgi:hypothetical protein
MIGGDFMNPNEALQILDQAVSQLQANREVHIKLQEAIGILKETIKSKSEKVVDVVTEKVTK